MAKNFQWIFLLLYSQGCSKTTGQQTTLPDLAGSPRFLNHRVLWKKPKYEWVEKLNTLEQSVIIRDSISTLLTMYWIVQALWRMRVGKSMILPVLKNSANLLFKKLQLLYTLQRTLNIWEGAHLCREKVFLWLSCVSLQSSVNRDIASHE